MTGRTSVALVLAPFLPGIAGAQDFEVAPGTVLAQDSSGSTMGEFELVQYSPDGVELDSFTTGFPVPFYGVMVGITVIDGEVWTIGTGSILARIDLPSGEMKDTHFTNILDVEAMSRIGSDLLVGSYGGEVHRLKTSGEVVWEFDTNVPMTGITTDGTLIYCANYQDGNVYVFDQLGNRQAFLPTVIGGYQISGLAYDQATGGLWVTTGFGDDKLRRHDGQALLLETFDVAWTQLNDLEVMPRACVDLFVPQIEAGTTLSITGHAPPSEAVALCVGLAPGGTTPFQVAGFCGASKLSPALGLLQLVTTSDAAGEWAVSAAIPPGVSLPVHLQAFAAGTCPTACSSVAVTRLIQ